MEHLNIAALLKDCPTGMELDCSLFEKPVKYMEVTNSGIYVISIKTSGGEKFCLTKEGYLYDMADSQCIIFPKGKTTWEGFQRPFKDGDIVALGSSLGVQVFIFKEYINAKNNHARCYVMLDICGAINIECGDYCVERFATEEEKEVLFKAIKNEGYTWNAETKTLEKLVKPKFKVGDRIKNKNSGICDEVIKIFEDCYLVKSCLDRQATIGFDIQDNWILVPNELIKSKFHEGDWITNGEYTWKVISVDSLDYTLQNQWGECVYDTIDYVNKVFHLWTINDAKEGDVLFHSDSASNGIFIFKEILQRGTINIQKVICYCDYDSEDGFCLGKNHTCCWTDSKILHPATKEQCDLLFQKMKKVGYKWNVETKVLEKVESKFKVGDKVFLLNYSTKTYTISKVTLNKNGDYVYQIESEGSSYGWWGENELTSIPNKFDVNTLVPFESKVLVRDYNNGVWRVSFWGCLIDDNQYAFKYDTTRGCFKQCIPYEGNEYLLGKVGKCDDYYKTWE